MKKNEFELIVRGLVMRGGKILVCKTHGRDYFFLPGGHIEFSEKMRDALIREFDEELGVRVINPEFIGSMENIFVQDGKTNHEINFIFKIDIDGEISGSREDHLTFYWFTPEELVHEKFVPSALRDAIIKWIADDKTFLLFAEEEDDLRS